MGALRSADERRRYFQSHGRLLRAETAERLDEAVVLQVRVDVQKAAALADAALHIAAAVRDAAAKGHAYRAKANSLYVQARHRAAIGYHRRAVAQFERAGDGVQVGRTLSAAMLPLLLTGEYDEALAAAARARALFEAAGERGRLTRLEINIGNVLYRQDRFAEALQCYRRAFAGLSRARGRKDVEGVAAVLSNIAVCQISLNDFHDALAAYRRARAYCLRHRLPLLVFQADYNIAYLHYLRGEYMRAIEGLRAAREACARSGDAYHAALCNLDLSEIYLELNLSAEAAELADDAHQRFDRLHMGYESAKALSNLAIALGREGKGLRALELFAAARALFVREKNLVWPWLTDLYQALILHEAGRHFEARRLAQGAFAFFGDSVLTGKAVLCQLLLARIALRLGELDAARHECLAALERLGGLERPALRHQAHFLRAQIEMARGDGPAAYASCQEARRALESLRGGLRGEELKMAFMKNKVEVYEMLVDLCLQGCAAGAEADAMHEAFGYFEQAKSRSLIEMMFHPVRRLLETREGSGQSQLGQRVRELREQLNWYYHRIEVESLSQSFSRQRVARLQEQAEAHEAELLRALREVPWEDDGGLDAAAAPMSLAAIRAALPPEGVLLEYFQAGERMLLARVSQSELEVMPVTVASRVHELMRLLRFQLAKFNLGRDYVEQFSDNLLLGARTHLAELYDELLAPAQESSQESPQAKHLVIVPHGILHYLPFHALFDGQAYLCDRCLVSYAPSASIYAFCKAKPARTEGGALVLGAANRQAPLIAEEARLVAELLPGGQLFTGEQATFEALRAHAAQARLLHIAAHGTFRLENPLFSSIHLSQSRLSLYDLYQLELPVELATLSGCATGLNVVAEGDELLGLVRGLLGAGARSLLLTLWDVNDRATLAFMRAFYGAYVGGQSKAAAAREAMLAVRRNWPHPYFWAPFVLIGA